MAVHSYKYRDVSSSARQKLTTMEPWSSWIAIEIEITWRMLADNALASSAPVLVLVTAVCGRANLQLWQTTLCLLKASILAFLYTYVFDVSNQAKSADEDKVNKPYRAIPQGLLTCRGALYRFGVAAVLYIFAAWSFGVMWWAVVWVMSSTVINLAYPPRHYFWCKTICMAMGVGSQLAQAWQLVTPIDSVGKRWIVFMVVAYPPPLIFEDVRDMAGDQAVGRHTLALIFGDVTIRAWFASIMIIMPVLVHAILFTATATSTAHIPLCTTSVATLCWTVALRAVILRDVKSDRQTYQISS